MRARTTTLGWLVILVVRPLQASDSAPPDVVVCFHNVPQIPGAVVYRARPIITSIFQKAGVRLEWKDCGPKFAISGHPVIIQVQCASVAPEGIRPEALAYAKPFADGSTITLLHERIGEITPVGSHQRPAVLAHVLAHEIGHVLQGTDGHSASGIMKAHWRRPDFESMADKPMEFTPYDREMIHRGLNARKANLSGMRPTTAPGPAGSRW